MVSVGERGCRGSAGKQGHESGRTSWSVTWSSPTDFRGGAQLAIDTTLVSALRRDGTSRPQADSIDGVAVAAARRNKARTYPELSGGDGRARLVVLAAEVGGRWSEEVRKFLGALDTTKARSAPVLLQPSFRACGVAPSLERFVGLHSSP